MALYFASVFDQYNGDLYARHFKFSTYRSIMEDRTGIRYNMLRSRYLRIKHEYLHDAYQLLIRKIAWN